MKNIPLNNFKVSHILLTVNGIKSYYVKDLFN